MQLFKTIKKLFYTAIAVAVGTRVLYKIEKQERIKKKCKEGTLTLWDLI